MNKIFIVIALAFVIFMAASLKMARNHDVAHGECVAEYHVECVQVLITEGKKWIPLNGR